MFGNLGAGEKSKKQNLVKFSHVKISLSSPIKKVLFEIGAKPVPPTIPKDHTSIKTNLTTNLWATDRILLWETVQCENKAITTFVSQKL